MSEPDMAEEPILDVVRGLSTVRLAALRWGLVVVVQGAGGRAQCSLALRARRHDGWPAVRCAPAGARLSPLLSSPDRSVSSNPAMPTHRSPPS